jgi:enoyl-CoA hydratase/carnithine racemase
MWRAVPQALASLDADPAVHAIVVAGEGEKAFISGADISQFKEKRSSAEAVQAYNAASDRASRALNEFSKPLMAMIRGYCIGGGLGVAIACDLRIASDNSRFGVPAAKLGLGYRYSGIKRLAELVGPSFTAEIFYTGRQFDAQEALQMGLVNRVLPVGELEKYVLDYAATITNNAPLTIAAVKRSLLEMRKDPGERDLELCQKMVEECFASEDYREGRTAFMEKRKPVFRGR